ncbi:MAG TPA: proline dehydrogenase family protein [Actinomycetota bacterium]|nr:proline dehydrogenase family protein [Actinomycetota bacterium]
MSGPPLRGPILWTTARPAVRRFVTESRLGRRVALRFVAGETLEAAIETAERLGGEGIRSMLDHLGENVASQPQCASAADHYVLALKRIEERPRLECNIAIKLTQLGLDLSTELCVENAERVLQAAAARGTVVMIDMESHEYVDRTLELLRLLRRRYDGVGVALQSYLYRTADDIFSLPEGTPVRLVKGAYLEPPDVAFPKRADVDRSYARLFATLASRGHEVHVATHDPTLLAGAAGFVERRGIPWERIELQMLYGIRTDLQREHARRGHPVRTYIPYGEEWYPYLTRRLAERPANVWFFASHVLRRGT